MQETLGVVSVSEITSITVGGESPIDRNAKRAYDWFCCKYLSMKANDLIRRIL